jgi:hypothetical protein
MTENKEKHVERKSLWLMLLAVIVTLLLLLPGIAGAASKEKSFQASADVTLEAQNSGRNYGSSANCFVNGANGRKDSTLLMWNISSLPRNSKIAKATIHLRVNNPSKHTYFVYGLKKDWEESEATWQRASRTVAWASPGASSTSSRSGDRDSAEAGKLIAKKSGTAKIVIDVALVQDWLDGSRRNYGVIIAEGRSSATDDLAFFCSETTQQTQRPKLVIEYR